MNKAVIRVLDCFLTSPGREFGEQLAEVGGAAFAICGGHGGRDRAGMAQECGH